MPRPCSRRERARLGLVLLLTPAVLSACGPAEVAADACPGSVNWTYADSVEGQQATVRGPVAGVSYRPDVAGEPTFINLGTDYPDPSRFTVIVWGADRGAFSTAPEDAYDGESLCVTGDVAEYEGRPQLEISNPEQVHVVG